MIKNWEMFNESDTYFENSPEFEKLVQKYALKKEDIKQFLDELEDECDFELDQFTTTAKEIDDDGFKLQTFIRLTKPYEIKEGLENYTKFIEEQSKDLKFCLRVFDLIEETENLKDKLIRINTAPTPSNPRLTILCFFYQEIKTNEVKIAFDEFTKTESIAGVILKKVIDELVKRGFDRSELIQKIDIDPDWEEQNFISYGIWADDDMYIVAEYDKKTKVLGFDDELIDDLKEYLDEM